MIYRIMKAPPGYEPEQRYMVGAYSTLDFDSFALNVTTDQGSKFVSSLDEARRLIPTGAKKLPFQSTDQFLELWEG
jgi:hypothetical protein